MAAPLSVAEISAAHARDMLAFRVRSWAASFPLGRPRPPW
jgi:hypothetical protein